MSPSTRSKPASRNSPPSGAETDAKSDTSEKAAAPAERDVDGIEIELETSRDRQIGWAVFGTIIGALLVWQLGTVGVWAGYALIAIGLYRAYQLVESYRHPAGTIAVSDKQVRLPRGLHRSKPVEVPPSQVTAVYFLRRSVPWNRAAPVLVVELGERALAYPRDWFASEAEQRRVVHALLSHCPIQSVSEPS
jgi:hypothetical protein